MLNLEKLISEFDINNFSTDRILNFLAENQKIIMAAFFIISLLIGVGIYNNYRVKAGDMRVGLSQELGKLETIKARDAAIGDLNNFKSTLPKPINELELIARISNYANLCHVTIASVDPAQRQNMGLYDIINISFVIVSDHFKETMLFMRTIEKSDPPLRIDSWNGSEGQDGKISSTIKLDAVQIHL